MMEEKRCITCDFVHNLYDNIVTVVFIGDIYSKRHWSRLDWMMHASSKSGCEKANILIKL